jgi:hypothetical protein
LEKEWKVEGRNLPMPNSNKRITHLRVVEQTVFVDDEGFAPLGTTFRREKVAEDYSRKALAIQLESAGKIAYQSRVGGNRRWDFSIVIRAVLLLIVQKGNKELGKAIFHLKALNVL